MDAPTNPAGAVPLSTPGQLTTISRFWPRVVAFVVDVLLLGAVGFVIGLVLFEQFTRLGPWGRLVGFALTLPYFSVLNSKLGGGQTFGKRLARVKVVGADGDCISFPRSLARYLILAVPYFFEVSMLPWTMQMSPIGVALGGAAFSLQLAVVYLYVFNRITRQSLHDVLAGTYVVTAFGVGRVPFGRLWKGHWAILGGLVIVVVAAGTLLGPKLMQMAPFVEVEPALEAILNTGKVEGAKVVLGTTWTPHGQTKFVHAQVTWKGRPGDAEKAADEIAAIVMERYPRVMETDMLVVSVRYGYDIGIASAWKGHTVRYPPEEWRKRLGVGSE